MGRIFPYHGIEPETPSSPSPLTTAELVIAAFMGAFITTIVIILMYCVLAALSRASKKAPESEHLLTPVSPHPGK